MLNPTCSVRKGLAFLHTQVVLLSSTLASRATAVQVLQAAAPKKPSQQPRTALTGSHMAAHKTLQQQRQQQQRLSQALVAAAAAAAAARCSEHFRQRLCRRHHLRHARTAQVCNLQHQMQQTQQLAQLYQLLWQHSTAAAACQHHLRRQSAAVVAMQYVHHPKFNCCG
jgi:hypothetical protein